MRTKHRQVDTSRASPEKTAADRLRGARLAAGLSQHQLSNLSGISIPMISLYERGARISRASAERLSSVLALDAAELAR